MYWCQIVNQITLWAIIWHLNIVQYLVGPYCNECHDDLSLGVMLRRHIRSGPPKPAPATCLSINLSNKISQFIYPNTNIPLFPYYLLPFQTGIWHLIWYLASSILYLASGIWHPIWYLASSTLYLHLASHLVSGSWHKKLPKSPFLGRKSLRYSYPYLS